MVNEYDFALFLLSPDDIAEIRGRRVLIARDNVLFETGLFFSQLGRKRTFLIAPEFATVSEEFHLPSDLNGLTLIRYAVPPDASDLPAKLGAACVLIEDALLREGTRRERDALRYVGSLSGGPVYVLRHLIERPRSQSEVVSILKRLNNASNDGSAGWGKAGKYVIQILLGLGMAEMSHGGSSYSATLAARAFLEAADVRTRFAPEFSAEMSDGESRELFGKSSDGQINKPNFERMAKHITNYLKEGHFKMASFERLRSNINTAYSDTLLEEMINALPDRFRKTRMKGGKVGVGAIGS